MGLYNSIMSNTLGWGWSLAKVVDPWTLANINEEVDAGLDRSHDIRNEREPDNDAETPEARKRRQDTARAEDKKGSKRDVESVLLRQGAHPSQLGGFFGLSQDFFDGLAKLGKGLLYVGGAAAVHREAVPVMARYEIKLHTTGSMTACVEVLAGYQPSEQPDRLTHAPPVLRCEQAIHQPGFVTRRHVKIRPSWQTNQLRQLRVSRRLGRTI